MPKPWSRFRHHEKKWASGGDQDRAAPESRWRNWNGGWGERGGSTGRPRFVNVLRDRFNWNDIRQTKVYINFIVTLSINCFPIPVWILNNSLGFVFCYHCAIMKGQKTFQWWYKSILFPHEKHDGRGWGILCLHPIFLINRKDSQSTSFRNHFLRILTERLH